MVSGNKFENRFLRTTTRFRFRVLAKNRFRVSAPETGSGWRLQEPENAVPKQQHGFGSGYPEPGDGTITYPTSSRITGLQ